MIGACVNKSMQQPGLSSAESESQCADEPRRFGLALLFHLVELLQGGPGRWIVVQRKAGFVTSTMGIFSVCESDGQST